MLKDVFVVDVACVWTGLTSRRGRSCDRFCPSFWPMLILLLLSSTWGALKQDHKLIVDVVLFYYLLNILTFLNQDTFTGEAKWLKIVRCVDNSAKNVNILILSSSEIRMSLFLHQVCRNVSLHQCLSNGCSAVNGCRQNESLIKTSQ